MAYERMKDFLVELERRGKLRRISRPVDRAWEPACLAKWMYQALPNDERFGLYFDHVKGSAIPLVTGALGASTQTYAAALEVEPDGINDKLVQALLKPIAPRTVTVAPCQEVVHRGDEVRLGDLPIPTWTPGKDAAPYITSIVVTRDAHGGFQNLGVYRTQVLDDRSVVVNLSPGRHGYRCVHSYLDQGKPAPIAWVIAAEPAVHLATVANLTYGTDEVGFAGGLKGGPIDLVKASSVDLMVPAAAEIIIEGEVLPGETADEGPFGEFAGFMGPVGERPRARITAITHRRDPIYYGLTSQMPPSESTVIQSLTNAGVILKLLRHDLGESTVRDVYIDLTFGGLLAHGVVAMTPRHPGHGKRVGRMLADLTPLKRVTVVDADVDIRDPTHVEWAMNSCFNPVRDTVIIDDVYFPLYMDPSIRTTDGSLAPGSKMVIDATQKIDAGSFSLPPRETMMRALDLWRELGLPEFRIPRRAWLRIERS
ncbi:MAG TPA: UbiD family decarboxylase [Candidatus Binataceae bacterium]|nr:UbiD family decarboxylase [Candidatus Binataceae bacterium]